MQGDLLEQELGIQPEHEGGLYRDPRQPHDVGYRHRQHLALRAGARVVVDNTSSTPVLQRPNCPWRGRRHPQHYEVHQRPRHGHRRCPCLQGPRLHGERRWRPRPLHRGCPERDGLLASTSIGLKTLPLRMREHCANARALAEFLDSNDRVAQ